MTTTVLHKAGTRGNTNYGWLDSYHTFSFGSYYHEERTRFGVLRVLNDDVVDGGKGFDTHRHDNMEIISIPLSGELEHKDSMGNIQVIRENDVQVMSAGSGIYHSEYNKSPDKKVNFLQIWVFPNKKNVTPRYDQKTFPPAASVNRLQQVLSPSPDDAGVWIHQDAWFYLGNFEKDFATEYRLQKTGNGVYVFVIEGAVRVNGQALDKRDGMGIMEADMIALIADKHTELLLMEVPMSNG